MIIITSDHIKRLSFYRTTFQISFLIRQKLRKYFFVQNHSNKKKLIVVVVFQAEASIVTDNVSVADFVVSDPVSIRMIQNPEKPDSKDCLAQLKTPPVKQMWLFINNWKTNLLTYFTVQLKNSSKWRHRTSESISKWRHIASESISKWRHKTSESFS